MLKLKFLPLVAMVVAMIGFSSCEKYFGDVNKDPNNPTSVTPSLLLPTIEVRLGYTMGGDASRYLSIFTQHVDGIQRQFEPIQNYGIQPGDVDALWDNLYSGVLSNLQVLRKDAEAAGNNHYAGVARALEAYTWLFITDQWGDVPYSQALQGTANLEPAFDSQASILESLLAKLTEAKDLLNNVEGGGLVPADDDLIYGGDVTKWIKFCNVVEARIHLRMAKADASMYSTALTALASGFDDASDDAKVPFFTGPSTSSPWYQYNTQRNDIAIGDSYVALMNGLSDPREAIYGAPLLNSGDHPYLTDDRAVNLLTYTEQEFVKAEALIKTGSNNAAAHDAYVNAISASFDEAGATGLAGYLGQGSVDPGVGNLTEDLVITQKYIALFADPEVFTDWRRTGKPALTPNFGSAIPRRLYYTQNEAATNPNTPTGVTLYDRVGWDVQ